MERIKKSHWILKRFDELTVRELYEILSLRNRVFIVEQKCPFQDIDGLDFCSYHMFSSNEEGKINAYLRIIEKGKCYDEASIGRVIVRADQRGTGIAREMMLKAIDFVENGLQGHAIRIGAQAKLTKFYEGVGFRTVSEIYEEDGIAHVEMLYHTNTKST